MGKRGTKPQGKVKIKWSPNFAYAIGLLATDGCLINNGRHIEICSKDKEQLSNYCKALGISVRLSGKSKKDDQKYWRIQFGDVLFYQFLLEIGMTPKKSKTLGKIQVPKRYFLDFFRGCFDGDGSFYSYWDPRWKSSYMFYIAIASSSPSFICWLRSELFRRLKVRGHISENKQRRCAQLRFAKGESLKIIKNMYYNDSVLCLSRKRTKIEKGLKEAGINK